MSWLARLKSLEAPKADPREPSKPGSLGSQGCPPEPLQHSAGHESDTEAPPPPACAGCAATVGKSTDRPYRLAAADTDVAHAEPWDDAAIGRFQARVQRIGRRGFGEQDADDLAERLHLRDVRGDDRRTCVECLHLRPRPWRCGNQQAAAVARELAAELVTTFQDCPGFNPAR